MFSHTQSAILTIPDGGLPMRSTKNDRAILITLGVVVQPEEITLIYAAMELKDGKFAFLNAIAILAHV